MATQSEIDKENRKIREVRLLTDLVSALLAQGNLSQVEMVNLIHSTRKFVLHRFPGKEEAFDLIYKSRFDRIVKCYSDNN